jgi:hypothetical protein
MLGFPYVRLSPMRLVTSWGFVVISRWMLLSSSKRGMKRSYRWLRAGGVTDGGWPHQRLSDDTLATNHGGMAAVSDVRLGIVNLGVCPR